MIRLCKVSLQQLGPEGVKQPPKEDSSYHDIILLLDQVFLPSLSHLDYSCCIAEEVWDILRNYPYQIRYCQCSIFDSNRVKGFLLRTQPCIS